MQGVAVRPMRREDASELGFVTQTWLRSSMRSKLAELIPRAVYVREESALVSRIVDRSSVFVAEAVAVPGELSGWICTDGDVLHFLYVKQPYRRLGIGRALMQVARKCKYASHWTRRADECEPLFGSLTFNPFTAFRHSGDVRVR